jgi:WD40 repeat protein
MEPGAFLEKPSLAPPGTANSSGTRERGSIHHSSYEFDAFISYSHAADGLLAPALQIGLEKIARPWYRLRSFRLFRDQTNLSANPDLWNSIESALKRSRWFILLASEEAARSKWVSKEIRWWLANRDASSILIVLTDGTITWNEMGGVFAAADSTALPPCLHEAFSSEPLYVDLRWARRPIDLSQSSVRLKSSLLDVAATLRGISKDELDGDAIRTLRRNRAWATAALGGLALAVAAALYWLYAARLEATRNSLELDATQVVTLTRTREQALALPLAIQTAHGAIVRLGSVSPSVLSSLRYGIESSREMQRWQSGGQVMGVTFDESGEHIIAVLRSNAVKRWTLNGSPKAFHFNSSDPPSFTSDQFSLRLSPSGTAILSKAKGDKWRIWGLDGSDLLAGNEVDAQLIDVAPSVRKVYTVDRRQRLFVHVGKGRRAQLLFSAGRPVKSMHPSPDGSIVALIYTDGSGNIVDTATKRARSLEPACREATGLAWEARRLVSAGCGGAVATDLGTLRVSSSEELSLALVDDIAVAQSGNFAVTHKFDDQVSHFNYNLVPATDPLLSVESPAIAISPDGKRLVMGGYLDGRISLFDLTDRSSRPLTTPARSINISTLDSCVDRAEVYWATQDGELASVRYLEEPAKTTSWKHGASYIESVRCVPGNGMVSADRDGSIIYWPDSEKSRQVLHNAPGEGALAVAVNRGRIVYAIDGGIIRRWKLGSKMESLPSLPTPSKAPWSRISSGKGDSLLLLGSYEGELSGIDAGSGVRKFGPLKVSSHNIWGLSADIGDSGFAAGGAGGDAATFGWDGTMETQLRSNRFQFTADMALDKKRKLIAIPSTVGTVLVSDLQGNPVGPVLRDVGVNQFIYLRFSPDRYLLSGALEFGVSITDFDPVRLLALACALHRKRMIAGSVEYASLSKAALHTCVGVSIATDKKVFAKAAR